MSRLGVSGKRGRRKAGGQDMERRTRVGEVWSRTPDRKDIEEGRGG